MAPHIPSTAVTIHSVGAHGVEVSGRRAVPAVGARDDGADLPRVRLDSSGLILNLALGMTQEPLHVDRNVC